MASSQASEYPEALLVVTLVLKSQSVVLGNYNKLAEQIVKALADLHVLQTNGK